MPWVRRGGRRYYYASRWADGKPITAYLGAGPAAKAAAAEVERRRAERVELRERLAADEAAHAAASAPLDELNELTDLLAKAPLVLSGFRQHDRGSWRKKK